MEREGFLETMFEDRPLSSLLDSDPFEVRQFMTVPRGMPGYGSLVREMQKIRKRKPWLYHALLEVWDDSYQRSEQAWDFEKLGPRHRTDFSADDQKAIRSPWSKFKRLVKLFSDDSALGMSSQQCKEEFDRIMNAPEEVQDKEKPVEKSDKKSKKPKREGKK